MASFLKFWVRRDLRSDRAWVYGFLLVLGIAALTIVGLFSARIIETSLHDTRKFMGADYIVRSWREPPKDMRSVLEGILKQDPHAKIVAQKTMFASALRTNGESLNVSLEGSEEGFPLYGEFIVQTTQGRVERPVIPAGGIFLDETSSSRGIKLGEVLKLGQKDFTVAGFIVAEPQSANFLSSLGYRAMVRLQDLNQAGLLVLGARVSHRFLIKTDVAEKALRKPFRQAFPDKYWRLISVRQGTEQIARLSGILTQILLYFAVLGSLMGSLTGYFLFRIRIRKKVSDFLTLKCLGLREGKIIIANLVLFLLLAAMGVVLGFGLGVVLENLVSQYARGWMGVDLSLGRPWIPTLLRVTAVALFSVLWSTYFPLKEVLRIPVNEVFSGNPERRVSGDFFASATARLQLASLLAISFLYVLLFSSSLKQALVTYFTLLVSVLLSFIFVDVILRLLQRFWMPRHSVLPFLLSRGLLRFPLRTRIVLISLVLGLFVVQSSFFLSNSLRSQINFARQNRSADLIVLVPDVKNREDLDTLRDKTLSWQWLAYSQARIYDSGGAPVREIRSEETEPEDSDEIGIREYFVNYRSESEAKMAGESLQSGKTLFGAREPDVIRLSIEKDFAHRIGAQKGQRLTLELGGVPLRGRIDSVREVNWFNFSPNFFLVAASEDLEGAPRSWIGLARIAEENMGPWQSKIVARSPQSVSLDSRAIAKKVSEILDKVDAAVFWVGLFLLMTLLVLIWGIASGRLLDWPDEYLLFRSLGLSISKQRLLLVMELLLMWLLAAVFSLALAAAMSWVLSHYLFKFPLWWPHFQGWLQLLAGVIAMAGLSLLSLRQGLRRV